MMQTKKYMHCDILKAKGTLPPRTTPLRTPLAVSVGVAFVWRRVYSSFVGKCCFVPATCDELIIWTLTSATHAKDQLDGG